MNTKSCFLTRILWLSVSLGLALPQPVFALRPMGAEGTGLEEMGSRLSGAEENQQVAKELEQLGEQGARIIGRNPETSLGWSTKWRDMEEHQQGVIRRLAQVTREQERDPEIRRWIPHLLMHQVLLLVNRNLPMNWGPGDPIPDPDALEKDLYGALKLSDQILKRIPPRQRASQSEQSLRQVIRIQQAHIVVTLSAAGMFKNIQTVQNALSDREIPTGYAFSLLSEAFRVHSESGTEPTSSKEASYQKAMAYALLAALSPPEDFPMLDQYETMAFSPLVEFIPEDLRHQRPKEKLYSVFNQIVKRRFGVSLEPDARDSARRVSESLRDEMLLASPAALLEVQGLAAWTLSDFFSFFRASHWASAFRLSAEKTEEEMAEKGSAVFRGYPAGRLVYRPSLRWEPMQILAEETEASGVMVWMNKHWDKMIPEPGILSHAVFLTLRQKDPGIEGHVTLVRQGFPLGDGWRSRLRAFLQIHAGPFWVVADQEVKTGQMAMVITNVRPVPPDQPPALAGMEEQPSSVRIVKEVKIPENLYGAAKPLKKEAARLTHEIAEALSKSGLFRGPIRVGDGRTLKVSSSPVLYSEQVLSAAPAGDDRRVLAIHLYEVIQNAVDAIADRMEVEQAIAQKGRKPSDYEGRIIVQARRQAGQLILEVSDNGIGIPRSFGEFLFGEEEFTSKEPGTRAGGLGKGLGLFGQRLLQVMGGRVEVETFCYNERGLAKEDRESPWGLSYRFTGGQGVREDLPAVSRRAFGTTFRWIWDAVPVPVAAGAEEGVVVQEYSGGDAGLPEFLGIRPDQRLLMITRKSAKIPETALVFAHADIAVLLRDKMPQQEIKLLMHPRNGLVRDPAAQEFAQKTIASFVHGETAMVILNQKYVPKGRELEWIPRDLRGKPNLTVLNLPEELVKEGSFTESRLALLAVFARRLGGVLSWGDFDIRFEGEQSLRVYL